MSEQGICPVCNGTKQVAIRDDQRRYQHMNALRIDADHEQCRNCGGQTMSLRATGKVNLRPDGTPCTHSFKGRNAGNCYNIYTCIHGCGTQFDIDSSD